MISEEKMREEFEEWAADNWVGSIDSAWKAWRASRESLSINLPLSSLGYIDGCSIELELMDADEVRESIHAAGVKTK